MGNGDHFLEVPASGGEVRALTALDEAAGERDQRNLEYLPDGDTILFTSWLGETNNGIDTAQIAVQRLSTGERRTLLAGVDPSYVASGHLLFARRDGLWAVAFDPGTLTLRGEPSPVHQGVRVTPAGQAAFAVSHDGTLVVPETQNPAGPFTLRTLVWVDRNGRETPVPVPPRAYTYARLSPDGSQIALDARDDDADVWIWNVARETLHRLTFDPGFNRSPTWTPDGTKVAFSASRNGVESIYWQDADGSSEAELLSVDDAPQGPIAFTPDGTRLLFHTPLDGGPFDIGMLTLGPPSRSEMVFNAAFSESNATVSPDGEWIAYQSSESGPQRPEIYVRPFPGVRDARQQVSTGGGTRPLWSRSGTELFYYVQPNRIMSVTVRPESREGRRSALLLGRPTVVVEGPYASPGNSGRHYDVSPDGERFLLIRDAEGVDATVPRLNVVLNWFDELRRLVPSR